MKVKRASDVSLKAPEFTEKIPVIQSDSFIDSFVSNKYVRKMYEEMKENQEAKYKALDKIF